MNPVSQLRSLASPHWNKWLNHVRLKRLLAVANSRGIKLDPVVYDIGARWGISPPFDRLAKLCSPTTVGFEPDPEEAAALKKGGYFDIVSQKALGAAAGKRVLHIAKDPGSSSLFAPDLREIARHTASPQFEVMRTLELEVQPLDDVARSENLPRPDYIKIDCEGAEGEILEGGKETLAGCCGIQFEARFAEFYTGGSTLCPLVDRFVRDGYVCLAFEPIGAFFGAYMMFDILMVKHPDSLTTQRQFLLHILLSLLFGKWTYAARTAHVRGADFDFPELFPLLNR